ncbi:MAG: glycosyltransferase [Kiritimatiellia bacterium]
MPAVHQILAGFTAGDAISNMALTMRGLLEQWGVAGDIYSLPERTMPAWRQQARDARQAGARLTPDDVAVLHLSIGSPVNDLFAQLHCRKAIVYHSVTPAFYFQGIHEQLARDLAWGRQQAAALAGQAQLVMAVSRFNAMELEDMGYREVRVLPLLLDFKRIMTPPDRRLVRRWRDGRINIVFVGRAVPNKRLEDLLQVFQIFQQTVAPESRLIHAGSFSGLPRYQSLLRAQASALRLRQVEFLGAIPQRELSAVYAAADVFLCLSEHEGFCIPILESMAHDLPVVARAAAAVPETMGGAGALFEKCSWPHVAELVGCVAREQRLREGIIRRQQERLLEYRSRDLAAELRAHLSLLLPGA